MALTGHARLVLLFAFVTVILVVTLFQAHPQFSPLAPTANRLNLPDGALPTPSGKDEVSDVGGMSNAEVESDTEILKVIPIHAEESLEEEAKEATNEPAYEATNMSAKASSESSKESVKTSPAKTPDTSKDVKKPSSSSKTSSTQDFVIVDRVAAIIETRPLTNLIPLLLHFSSVLGPKWPILLYTSERLSKFLVRSASVPFARALQTGHIQMRMLPTDTNFSDMQSVSKFLTSTWFWEDLEPAEHVLLFQADSILCSKSSAQVSDFFKFDFIGSPIAAQYGVGYNGGLSLRNRTLSVQILRDDEKAGDSGELKWTGQFEDQWYYEKMVKVGAKLPSREEALSFAVETIWAEKPMGYHQVMRWNSDRTDAIERWCPEFRLSTSEYVYGGSGEAASWADVEKVLDKE